MVSVDSIAKHRVFRRGRPVMVMKAYLYVHEGGVVRREPILVGDQVMIAGQRWQVVELVEPTPQANGGVVLEQWQPD
jgi:hypothetical protein